MFGTEGSKPGGACFSICSREKILNSEVLRLLRYDVCEDCYKVTEVSEERAVSFVRVQKVQEEDAELGGVAIRRNVTMNSSTQHHITEGFILNQCHCKNLKYRSLC